MPSYRLWNFRLYRNHPNLVFWACFLILNALLFLPIYLLNQEITMPIPGPSLFDEGLRTGIDQLLIWRQNLDPFRISLELALLTALWTTLPWLRRRLMRYLIVVSYLLALCYYVYEAIVVSIYLLDPVFYSQYYLARDGLPFLARQLQTGWWTYAVALVGLAVAGTVLAALVNALLQSAASPALHRATRIAIALLAGSCVLAGILYQQYTAMPEMVVSSLGFKLQKNLAASLKLATDIASFDDSTVRISYDYANDQLAKRPDIYMIFVESYGSVLYKRAHFRSPYLALLTRLEKQLDAAGWHSTSALSESSTWGGGSWLAYTSVMFGLRIDNHPQYLTLFDKYQVDSYPTLGRTLQKQGYYYVWLSSLVEAFSDRVWSRYTRFYGVDELLRDEDLDYHGPRYGWGPAAPDQYTLNRANEMLQDVYQPLFFFTITQNSHYPWTPHPELVDDWHTLNREEAEQPQQVGPPPPAEVGLNTNRRNYMHAVEYQLEMLTDFILRNGDKNSLFVLIGDHQPPQVSRRADGWSTPVHILSQDQALIDAFAAYGFTRGLHVDTLEPDLRHEAIYSLLIRTLVEQYGADGIGRSALPNYLPHGATPERLAHSGLDERGP